MKKISIMSIVFFLGIHTSFAEDVIIFKADHQNRIVIEGEAGANTTLFFGDTLTHFLEWDETNNYFIFSDNVNFSGNEILDVKLEKLSTAPTCTSAEEGRVYYNTTDKNSYSCNGSTWDNLSFNSALDSDIPFFEQIYRNRIDQNQTMTLEIVGNDFLPTSTVSIPGFSGTIDTVSVVSPELMNITISTANTAYGTYDIVVSNGSASNTFWAGNGEDALSIVPITYLVPDDGTTSWVRTNTVTTSLGKIVPSSTASGWTKGGSFGTVPANTDMEVSFNPVYMAGQSSGGYAMVGIDVSDPSTNYNTIDHAFYFQNGSTLYIYENGSSRGVFGSFTTSDTFSIKRASGVVTYYKNGTALYTSPNASTGTIVFDNSLYRYLGVENIEMTY